VASVVVFDQDDEGGDIMVFREHNVTREADFYNKGDEFDDADGFGNISYD
jgi:hypothetical protein